MATFDEVLKAEDALASAYQEYRDFKRSDEGMVTTRSAADADPRFVDAKTIVHVSEARFKRDEVLRDKVARAERALGDAQRQWLRFALPPNDGRPVI